MFNWFHKKAKGRASRLLPRDWRGTIISPGCRVVYPVRQGSDMWMREGTVSYLDISVSPGDPPPAGPPGAYEPLPLIYTVAVAPIDSNRTVFPRLDRMTVVGRN
jgi:hypothetical protein